MHTAATVAVQCRYRPKLLWVADPSLSLIFVNDIVDCYEQYNRFLFSYPSIHKLYFYTLIGLILGMTLINEIVYTVGAFCCGYFMMNILVAILDGLCTFVGSRNLRNYGSWAIVTGWFIVCFKR